MTRRRAFTLMELLVVLLIITVLIALLLPALGRAKESADQTKSASHLRGLHAGMAIFAGSNNGYLPGLDKGGRTFAGNFGDPLSTVSSGLPSSRLWTLLDGVFLSGDLAIHPHDAKARWSSGRVTRANFSYALLEIENTTSAGRLAEWKDSANSEAITVTDRALDGGADPPVGNAGVADASIRSVWTVIDGDWKGGVVWGDDHVDWSKTQRGFQTRYLSNLATGDNLFADGDGNPAGATEQGTTPGGQAFMVFD